ncbi:MAG: HD domain-containing protein [Candidatus Microsaccharimonas sp.]
MKPNTSPEQRVDALMHLSERIYPAIDEKVKGETRARQMVRLSINAIALSLRSGQTLSETGDSVLSLMNEQFTRGGLAPSHPTYRNWQKYQNYTRVLPRPVTIMNGPLNSLANKYSDVQRATLDHSDQPESDARHAIHLMGMAVPYAMEFYPDLDHRKIAVYTPVHDLVEAYANDVASLGITPEQKKQKDIDEAKAVETLEREYGAAWPEFVKLIRDYEELSDDEAKFSKSFDKLDPGFTHFNNNGYQLIHRYKYDREQFATAFTNATQSMMSYSADYPLIIEDRMELNRRVVAVTYGTPIVA